MKKVLFATLLVVASVPAYAADAGIGVSVQSQDAWIYVPIDITSGFRLEPSIRFVTSESTTHIQDTSFGSSVTGTMNSESKDYELALGLFGVRKIADAVSVYFGGRIAYIKREDTVHTITQFSFSKSEETQEVSGDGYRISPTFGLEYFFNEHFSIGAEAEWFYQDTESNLDVSDGTSGDNDSTSTGNDTRLIARFRF